MRCIRCLVFLNLTLLMLPSVGQAQDQAQIEQWKERFRHGVALEKEGKTDEALAVFEGILNEDSKARGSLLLSAGIYIRREQYEKAAGYYERFLALEPNHEAGLIGGIKAYQSIGSDDKVDAYRKQLLALRAAAGNPRLNAMLSYEREYRVLPQVGNVTVLESFEQKEGRYIWAYLLLGDKNRVVRRLEWIPIKAPGGIQYVLSELKNEGEASESYKIYRMLEAMPSYDEARELAIGILKIR